jgi:hypothetical protein
MDWAKQSEEMMKAWTETQKKMMDTWLDTMQQATGQSQANEMWQKNCKHLGTNRQQYAGRPG